MTSLGVYLRGLAMGAADIVPGVSGGTVAFITGIYPALLNSIRSFDLTAVQYLLRAELAGFWRHVNGRFLLLLVAGIATSVFTLARWLSWVLEHYPEPLWGFFFGLILASAGVLLRRVSHWRWPQWLALLAGAGLALYIALAPGSGFVTGLPGIFLAGFIAVCAMLLPGISGSFILLLLGMYSSVLAALRDFDFFFLGVFLAGAVLGLAVFSRLLHWLLQRFHTLAMALLTGFLSGSLVSIWPWKYVSAWVAGSGGILEPAQRLPVMPAEYFLRTGADPRLLPCLLLAVLGALLVWRVESKWGRPSE